MKKTLLIILLSFAMNGYTQSYQKQLGSLEKKIKKLSVEHPSFHRDTLMVNYLLQKSTAEISSINSEIGISTAKEALKLSENRNWNKGILLSLFGLAEGEEVKSRYFTSIKYCLRILSVIDKKEFPYLYTNTLQLVAGSYMWMEKPKESLLYFNQLFKEITPQNISKSRLGDAYTGMGILHIKYLKNPQVAYQYLVKAGKDYAAIKDTFGLAYMNSYMGLVYEKLNQPKQAEQAFDFAITTYKRLKADYILPDALNYAAEYYERKGNYSKAKALATEALTLSEKMDVLFSTRDANKNLYLINKATGNYQEALKYHETFANTRDSMSEASIDDRLKVVRYEYDTQMQKVEIEQKTKENEQKNILIISLLVGIVGLIGISFLLYRNINIRKQIAEKEVQQLQQEKQLIATNAVLKGQEAERSRLARDLHDGLGGILSGIKFTLNTMSGNVILSEQSANLFGKALTQLDAAITEMRRVAHSMMPEALLKFGLKDALQDFCEGVTQTGKIKVHFQTLGLEERLEQSTEITLYRIVQELLNNAMKHAHATDAYVQLMQDGKLISLTVEDNGKGFNINELEKNKGAGISSVASRVAYLNGKFDIKSDENGTSIEVQIIL